ncbi:MAG: nucleoside deaminase [Lactobacillales bacterium]|jgi:cytidine deaminase|nr:nucleoside deaminase [Lactobacillales bacterium]
MNDLIFKAALHQARKAGALQEVPVGAVVFDTRTGEIVAKAFNQTEKKRDPTAHAEILAVQKACRKLKCKRLPGYSLFVTLEPCPMCAGALSLARLDHVYFGAFDPKTGGLMQGARVFEHPQTHHKPQLTGGICAPDCGALLSDFFKAKRGEKK